MCVYIIYTQCTHTYIVLVYMYIYLNSKKRKVRNDFSDRVIKVWVNFILPDKFTSGRCELAVELSSWISVSQSETSSLVCVYECRDIQECSEV